MKNIYGLFKTLFMLMLLVAVTIPTFAATDTGFEDVPSDSWYAEPVAWAVEHGITAGTSATTFSPEATCSNAEVLTFLWRACGAPDSTRENPFEDVSSSDYYYRAALWAYQNGMVYAGSFQPDKPCTRSMVVTYMWNVAGSPEVSYTPNFDDVQASDSYASAVTWALEKGVTAGTSATTFSPFNTCTRAEIVTFLYRGNGVGLIPSPETNEVSEISYPIIGNPEVIDNPGMDESASETDFELDIID